MERDDDFGGLSFDELLDRSRQLRIKADAARRGLAEVVERIRASRAVAERLRAETAAERARRADEQALPGSRGAGHVAETVTLLYVSRAAPALSAETIASMTRAARLRNLHDGITGLLACDGTHFLHMVEGPAHAIVDLEQRLRRDRRHGDIDVLSLAPAKKRLRFPHWRLGFVAFPPGAGDIGKLRGARGDDALARFDETLPMLDETVGTAMPA